MNEDTTNDSILIAANYRLVATGFHMSAKKLRKHIQVDENSCPKKYTALPLYYLACHTTELYLKAALLKRGFSEKDLKKYSYRHNLQALLDELLNLNVPISNETCDVVSGFSEQHKEHLLRYSTVNEGFVVLAKFWPTLNAVFDALDELLLTTRISTYGI